MSSLVPEPVWRQVRRGRPPDPELLDEVAGTDRATLGEGGVRSVRDHLHARLLGAGPLEELLASEGVTDVMVNGDGSVWWDRGHGIERAEVDLGGPEARRQLAVRLAGLAGRRLDDTAPYVDGQLPSGVRLHAMLPPLVDGGAHLTLRVPARARVGLEELARSGLFPGRWLPLLRSLVHHRVAFLVSGGTGAGKTTLLGALLAEAEPAERLVVVEDVRELRVDHPHVVRLEARPPNVEGAGEVTMTTLVRQALRMRPDRLIVGEVRGPEVRELLTALNTGHDGGCGTVHANAAADVVSRFEALGALAGLSLPAVHAQLVSAVDVVIHLRGSPGQRGDSRTSRVVDAISVLERTPAGRPRVTAALCGPGWADERGPGWARLADLTGPDRLDGPSRRVGPTRRDPARQHGLTATRGEAAP